MPSMKNTGKSSIPAARDGSWVDACDLQAVDRSGPKDVPSDPGDPLVQVRSIEPVCVIIRGSQLREIRPSRMLVRGSVQVGCSPGWATGRGLGTADFRCRGTSTNEQADV